MSVNSDSSRGLVEELVQAGLLAPSGDNCQPWQFVWNGRSLEIHFVASRAESLYDVQNLASWISLGATLANMRIAARQRACHLQADLFPQGEASNPVALVSWQPEAGAGDPLYAALERRCVNRLPYQTRPLPELIRQRLEASVDTAQGVSLRLVENERGRRTLASLAALNERLLFENTALHHGLYRWLRWSAAEVQRTGDGMPIGSLGLHRIEEAGFRLLGARPLANSLAAVGLTGLLPIRTQRVYARSSAIGLLSVPEARPVEFVRGGEALERLWLTATAEGLAFQPMTGVTFLVLRCRLLKGAGLSRRHQALLLRASAAMTAWLPELDRAPVMLFRIGFAEAPKARALRRPISAVLSLREQREGDEVGAP
ncbi:MAG: hypothetical protein HYZ92_00340 [Candidatus Omnitrophica bacterium]|nr:hypothetical protein [Candidatus Omnitrophota bacterium]